MKSRLIFLFEIICVSFIIFTFPVSVLGDPPSKRHVGLNEINITDKDGMDIGSVKLEGYNKTWNPAVNKHVQYCIPSGPMADCYMQLRIKSEKDLQLLNNVTFKNLNGSIKMSDFEVEYWDSNYKWNEEVREWTCENYSDYRTCREDYTNVSRKGKWLTYGFLSEAKNEKLFRIKLPISEGETIDVIPTVMGVEIDDWAWFTGYNRFAGYSIGAQDNGEAIGTDYNRHAGTNFTANATGTIKVVNYYIKDAGAVSSGILEVYVVNMSSGAPSLAWNVSNGTYNAGDISTTLTWYQSNMSDGPVEVDKAYFVGLMMNGGDGTNYLYIGTDNDGATATGQMRWWQALSGSGSFTVISGLRAMYVEVWGTIATDTTAPTLTVHSPTNTSYLFTNTSLNLSGNEALTGCVYSIDGKANLTLIKSNDTNFFGFNITSSGSHNILLACNDTANNWGASSVVHFDIESVNPTITLLYPANDTYSSFPTTLANLTGNENLTYCESRKEGIGSWNVMTRGNATNYFEFRTTTTEGSYHMNYSCNDTANNWGHYDINFTIDNTDPTANIISLANASYKSQYAVLNISLSEIVFAAQYSINGGANTTLTRINDTSWWANYSAGGDGSKNVIFSFNDTANNWGASSVVHFTLDTTPPDLTVWTPINITYKSRTSIANLSGEENITNCQIKMDAGSYVAMTNSNSTNYFASINTGSDGAHNFTMSCDDLVGNAKIVASPNFIIDTVNPVLVIHNPANDTFNYLNVVINMSGSEDLTFVRYSINGTANATMTKVNSTNYWVNFTSGGDGQYQIIFSYNDTADNWNYSTYRYFTIDTTDPTLTVVTPANTTYSASTLNFNVTSNEDLTSCFYSLNESLNQSMTKVNATNYQEQNTSSDSSKTVIFACNDTANNWAASSLVYYSIETGLDVTVCRNLTTQNALYTLQNSITSVITCLEVLANNVTVNGNGKIVTYGNVDNASEYYGVYSIGHNYTYIANLTTTTPFPSRTRYGVFLKENHNGTIVNVNSSINNRGINTWAHNDGNFQNVTALNNTVFGISLYNSSLINLRNATANLNIQYGLRMSGTQNSTISDSIFNTNTIDGIQIYFFSKGNLFHNISTNGNLQTGVSITSSSDGNTFNNLTCQNDVYYGIYILDDDNNFTSLYINNASDGQSSSYGAIWTTGTNGTFSNFLVNNSGYYALNIGAGILSFKDGYIQNSESYDVYVNTDKNATFTNVTYSSEIVSTGSLFRKWYFKAFINDTNSNKGVVNANVTLNNVTGSRVINATTDANGYTATEEYTEYINGTTYDVFNAYSIKVNNYTTPPYNADGETNITRLITNKYNYTITLGHDAVGPSISVISPTNVTYAISYVVFNLSLGENGTGYYSVNGGANVSMTIVNSTNIWSNYSVSSDGSFNVIFSVNDTANNWAATSLTHFTVDTLTPNVSVLVPSNATYAQSNLNFNVSTSEYAWCRITFNNGSFNYTMTPNATNTGFNYTNSSIADGSYLARFYCNDTVNYLNNSVKLGFSIDTVSPNLTTVFPLNNTEYTFSHMFMNVSINEDATYCNLSLDDVNQGNMTKYNATLWYLYLHHSDNWHNVSYYCNDTANNWNSLRVEFRVYNANPGESGGGSSGGGSSTKPVSQENKTLNYTTVITKIDNKIISNATSSYNKSYLDVLENWLLGSKVYVYLYLYDQLNESIVADAIVPTFENANIAQFLESKLITEEQNYTVAVIGDDNTIIRYEPKVRYVKYYRLAFQVTNDNKYARTETKLNILVGHNGQSEIITRNIKITELKPGILSKIWILIAFIVSKFLSFFI